jgi:hypothetical protein
MNLSPHFTLDELTVSETADRKGLDNTPDAAALENLKRLAAFLEQVRSLVGKPIHVNSAYRAPAVNASVGGSKTSQHCLGLAADLRVRDMTPDQVVRAIKASDLQYDQLIREFSDPKTGGGWTHVSIAQENKPVRKQALIIDRNGARAFA